MKRLILAAIIALSAVNLLAQGVPPVVQTNIVRLSPKLHLRWQKNPEPDVAGYWVKLAQGTNSWRAFTTNTSIPVLSVSSELVNGPTAISVAAVNKWNMEGAAATVTTNLVKPPTLVVNVRFEISLE